MQIGLCIPEFYMLSVPGEKLVITKAVSVGRRLCINRYGLLKQITFEK